MDKRHTLSIDIGTSSIRAAVFDERLRPRRGTAVKIPHSPITTPDGGSYFEREKLFERLIEAIDRVATKSWPIDAVGMCAFWHGLVGIDERGRPTTPVLTWADRRSREFTPVLKERFDEAVTHDRTGAHFHSSFWPSKLLWFRREFPDVWARTVRWCSFADLVAARLFGECVTSVSMASATGIFDQRRCTWDSELTRYLKVKRASLPRVAADGESFRLTRKYARRWPSLAKAAWFPAIGDGAADHIGSCGIGAERASLMIGTSAAMRVAYTGEPPTTLPEGLWFYRIDSKTVVVGGALSDGGNLYALIKKMFRLSGDIESRLARREAADELVVIPFFHGERSTDYDENANGAIIGMTAGHDGIDVLRAAMEGVAFRLADIMTRLETVADIREIVASGGALRRSPAWQQKVADALAHNLTINDADEAALRGAAIYARDRPFRIRPLSKTSPKPGLKFDSVWKLLTEVEGPAYK